MVERIGEQANPRSSRMVELRSSGPERGSVQTRSATMTLSSLSEDSSSSEFASERVQDGNSASGHAWIVSSKGLASAEQLKAGLDTSDPMRSRLTPGRSQVDQSIKLVRIDAAMRESP